ncbi:MAG TPA: 23S rRNA (uracil(1939)-C(5))-methyltransferase RlmD [Armatimonadetes bacterium]|nr:23S rRNA (uracil(1939)-C(5))-methyltransferase RlmD [Armatimonadota bacterium]
MASPVQEGQTVSLRVDSLAYGGEGVGRVERFPVFVPYTAPGDLAEVRLTRVHKRFARGEVVRLLEPGPGRVEPFCPRYGTCGGCQWQHLAYEVQVQAKTQLVRDALTRIGGLSSVPVRDTISAPEHHSYRNKVEVALAPAPAGWHLGYHRRGSPEVVDVETCPLLKPRLNELLSAVRETLREFAYPPYDVRTSAGLVREFSLRCNQAEEEATLLFITGRREVPHKRPFFTALRERCPFLVGFAHHARTRASQKPQGRPVGALEGRPLREQFGEVTLEISPASFFQVNVPQLENLWRTLRLCLLLGEGDTIVDAYAGVGTFALRLAPEVEQVIAVEVYRPAAQDARHNARRNGCENVTVERGAAEEILPRLAAEGLRAAVVLLDPPRSGCQERVLRASVSLGPHTLVYLSCDPTTLARDLRRLAALDYLPALIQPFDFFPQTYHVETLVVLKPARLTQD